MLVVRQERQCLGCVSVYKASSSTLGVRWASWHVPVHGKPASVSAASGSTVFEGLPDEFDVARYHSLHGVDVPDELEVVATTESGGEGSVVMGVEHKCAARSRPSSSTRSILTNPRTGCACWRTACGACRAAFDASPLIRLILCGASRGKWWDSPLGEGGVVASAAAAPCRAPREPICMRPTGTATAGRSWTVSGRGPDAQIDWRRLIWARRCSNDTQSTRTRVGALHVVLAITTSGQCGGRWVLLAALRFNAGVSTRCGRAVRS